MQIGIQWVRSIGRWSVKSGGQIGQLNMSGKSPPGWSNQYVKASGRPFIDWSMGMSSWQVKLIGGSVNLVNRIDRLVDQLVSHNQFVKIIRQSVKLIGQIGRSEKLVVQIAKSFSWLVSQIGRWVSRSIGSSNWSFRQLVSQIWWLVKLIN